MGSISVFLRKPTTKRTCKIFLVGSGLTTPSRSVHRQACMGVVSGTEKAMAFYLDDPFASLEWG